jgi:hypothetical protein
VLHCSRCIISRPTQGTPKLLRTLRRPVIRLTSRVLVDLNTDNLVTIFDPSVRRSRWRTKVRYSSYILFTSSLILRRISTANDYPNDLDSRPSSPSSVSLSYLHHRSQSKLASYDYRRVHQPATARRPPPTTMFVRLTPFLLLANTSNQSPTVPTLLTAV